MEQENEKHDGVDSSKTLGLSLGGTAHKSRVPRALVFNKASSQKDNLDHEGGEQASGTLEGGRDTLSDTDKWRDLTGCRVCISGVKHGTLRYFGKTQFAEGLWCGVELFEPVGKNDGSVKGIRYFNCQPNHGIFAPFTKVQLTDMSPNACGAPVLDGRQDGTSELHATATKLPPPKMVPKDFFLRASLVHDGASSEETRSKDSVVEDGPLKNGEKPLSPTSAVGSGHTSRTDKVPSPSQCSADNGFREETMPSKNSFDNFIPSCAETNSLEENSRESSCRESLSDGADGVQLTNSRASQQSLHSPDILADSSSDTDSAVASTPINPPEDLNHEDVENLDMNKTFSFEDLKRRKESVSLSEVLSSGILDKCDDFEDDQMSLDLDESLCILTPSQMKDFTVCADLEAITLPSSESFDDINDIPEDEQVQDIITEFISSDETPVIQTVSMTRTTKDFPDSASRPPGWESGDKVTSVDEIFYSIHCKDAESYTRQSSAATTPTVCTSDKDDMPSLLKSMETDSSQQKSDHPEEAVDTSSHPDSIPDTEDTAMQTSHHRSHPLSPILERKCEVVMSPPAVPRVEKDAGEGKMFQPTTVIQDLSGKEALFDSSAHSKNTVCSALEVDVKSEEGHTVQFSPRATVMGDSLETIAHADLLDAALDSDRHKNQLSVTWEDCKDPRVVESGGKDERPDSVYTVGSNDTGYQEDEDFDQQSDAGTTAHSPSREDLKRFSTVSRDSCMAAEEGEVEKIMESASTSGYSTGLSDSCTNEKDGGEDFNKSHVGARGEQKDYPKISENDATARSTDGEGQMHAKQKQLGGEDSALKENLLNGEYPEGSTEEEEAVTSDARGSEENGMQNGVVSISTESSTPEMDEKMVRDQEEGGEGKEVVCNGLTATEEEDAADENETSELVTIKESPSGFFSKTRSGRSKNKSDSQKRNKKDDLDDKSKKDIENEKVHGKPPKKNVMSKIKAMIEATSCKTLGNRNKAENGEHFKKSVPKKSRWEAVTSRIAASLAEEKTKPKKKEVRSKVDTNLAGARQLVARKSPKTEAARSICSVDSDSVILSLTQTSRNWRNTSDHQSDISGRNSVITDSLDGHQNGECVEHGRRSPKTNHTSTKYAYHKRPPGSSRSASPIAPSEGSSISLISRGSQAHSQVALRHNHRGSSSTIASVQTGVNHTSRVAPTAPARRHVAATTAAKSPSQVRKKGPYPGKVQPLVFLPALPSSKNDVQTACFLKPTSCCQYNGYREQQPTKKIHHTVGSSKSTRPPASSWVSRTELNQEIQRLGSLCEARTKELTMLKMKLKHAAVGFDAFAVVVRYLTEELDVFSHPQLVAKVKKMQEDLLKAENQLSQYQEELENQRQHHAYELASLSEQLSEVHQKEILQLKNKHGEEIVKVKDQQIQQMNEVMNSHLRSTQSAEKKYSHYIESLQKEHLRQKEELILAHKKELEEAEEVHKETQSSLNRQIEELREQFSCVSLRARQAEETLQRDSDSKIQWILSKKADLEKEVDSLKAVLEMKRNEIHTLRKENLEMRKELEQLPIAREKIKMLTARAEDLQALIKEKIRIERQLSSEHCQLKESFEKGYKENKRLSMENEELAWKLKQNTETNLLLSSLAESPDVLEKLVNDLSPLKSPVKHPACRPTFFTFTEAQNTEELPNSLQAGTPYRRIPSTPSICKPTCTDRLTHLAKSPSSPGPRKCRGSVGVEGQTSPRDTPRKFKHSPQKTRTSPRRKSRLSESTSSASTNASPNAIKNSVKDHTDLVPSEEMISSTSSDGSAINEMLLPTPEMLHSDETVPSVLRLQNQHKSDNVHDSSLKTVDGDEKSWQFIKEMKILQNICENDSKSSSQGETDSIPEMLSSIPDAKQYYHMAFTEANKSHYLGTASEVMHKTQTLHNGEISPHILNNADDASNKDDINMRHGKEEHDSIPLSQTICDSKNLKTEKIDSKTETCNDLQHDEQTCLENELAISLPNSQISLSNPQENDSQEMYEASNFCVLGPMQSSFVSVSDSTSFLSQSSKPSCGSHDIMSQSLVDDASLNSVSSGEQFENIASQEGEMCSLQSYVQGSSIFSEQKYTGLLQNFAGEAMIQDSSVSISLNSSSSLPIIPCSLVNKVDTDDHASEYVKTVKTSEKVPEDKDACLAQVDPASLENSSHGLPLTDSTNLDTSLGEEELPSE